MATLSQATQPESTSNTTPTPTTTPTTTPKPKPIPPPYPDSPSKLGILFIHGMGEHRRGDTLRRLGEPIYAWLDSWRAAAGPTRSLFVDDTALRLPHLDEPDAPPHTRITISWPEGISSDDRTPREQTWVAAEAWWSDEFNPPAFSEVASWSMALAPGLLVRYVRAGLARSRLWWWAGIPLGYVAAGLFQLVLMALLIVGIIPPLRRYVAGVQVRLTGAFGDPFVMVASPIRFNAILSRLERNLAWLREQDCERIAIVAHSQGSGIALRALQRRSDRVGLLVTFGTAIEKLHIAAELQAIRRRLGAAITVNTLALVAIAVTWILGVVALEWLSLTVWIVGSAVVSVLAGTWVTWWSGRQIGRIAEPDLTIPQASDDGEVTESRELTWRDFWTVADPVPDHGLVPATPTDAPPGYRPIARDSAELVNRWSLIKDHSIYPDNHEGFVGPVFARLVALSGVQPDLPATLDNAFADAVKVRRRRVRCLSLAWWIAVAGGILLPLLSQARAELESIGRPIRTGLTSTSDELGISFIVKALDEKPWASTTIGAVLVIVMVAAWYRLAVCQGWRIWDKAEADCLAITLLALPVAEGPFVLDAGQVNEIDGVRAGKTPYEIAAQDRINGAWLFITTALAFPAVLATMTVCTSRATAYDGRWWSWLAEPWARLSLAGFLLVLSTALLVWMTGRALGGWQLPWAVRPRPAGTPPATPAPPTPPIQPVPPPPGLPAA